jgi:hypothetical protein
MYPRAIVATLYPFLRRFLQLSAFSGAWSFTTWQDGVSALPDLRPATIVTHTHETIVRQEHVPAVKSARDPSTSAHPDSV